MSSDGALYNVFESDESSDTFNEIERAVLCAYLSLLHTTPYSKIKVKDVTDRCGLSRTVFYRHFDDLLDLLDRLERFLLGQLVLYRAKSACGAEDDPLAGKPFESMERWFAEGIRLRPVLGLIMGENGDPYFKERLSAQVRRDLNAMMDDDRAPRNELRPYYVAQLAGSYIGLLSQAVRDKDEAVPSTRELATISNSVRVAYYRHSVEAPAISDNRLFGE